jgi:hypothetical protein
MKLGTSKVDSNNKDKNFLWETEEDSNCNCWVCKAQKNRMKIIQRDNFRLSVMFGFEQ